MDLCRLYEGLYPLDLYLFGRNTQTTFTALSARVLPRPGGFPPLYSVGSGIPRVSAGDMMAVHQTPLSRFATQYSCECGTIIYCSVATIPLSGPYSCAYASFSLDSAGTESLAGAATLHDHAIACVNG